MDRDFIAQNMHGKRAERLQYLLHLTHFSFELKPLSFFILIFISSNAVSAEKFNPAMLNAGGDSGDLQNVNLDYFAEKGGQMPGTYQVDIYLNNQQVDSRSMEFVSLPEAPGKLFGVITPAELSEYGVKLDAFPNLKAITPQAKLTKPLSVYVPEATENLDLSRQRYDITVPQIGVSLIPRNSVDPKRWDNGIAAFMLNYSFSGSTTERDDSGQSKSNYLNVRSGMNLGAWRLRNYSTYNQQETDGSSGDSNTSHYESINTYLQRDVRFLQGGQLTIGEYSTPSDVFDSIQFTGAQLASDDQMLPDSMSQFAPTVRGIAKSNAQVTIKQNGYVIYQSNVSPGAFAITDLYPSGSGGDMEVTVTESDGSKTTFTVASSSVPILQREHRYKYNLALGKYRSSNDDSQMPKFIQFSNIYGLTARTTIYGGIQYAENYRSGSLGIGVDLGAVGAVSFDATQASSEFDGSLGTTNGQSYRVMYAKNFEDTDTNLQIAGYRYSTKGYYAFSDVQDYLKETDNDFDNYNRTHNQRSKLQISINQNFGDYGSISFSGSQQDYWGGDGKEKLWQFGYNTSLYGITYGLNYNYSKNPGMSEADQIFAFNVSIPLDKFMGGTNAWATYNMSTKRHGSTIQQAGISGTLLEGKNLSYSANQGYENQGKGASGNANLDYKGGSGEGTLGYSYDQDSHQWSYGLQGGILIHEDGITLSQSLGDTIALVKAPGASDVNVENNIGVHTDWRGYAVVPNVQPYRKNSVGLDTQSFGDDVDIDINNKTVIPTRGAVVRADFNTRVGQRALMQLLFMGKPVPFGATVSLLGNENSSTGIVSDNGEVYLTGLPESGKIMAKWGNGSEQQCQGSYSLVGGKADEKSALIQQITAQCQ